MPQICFGIIFPGQFRGNLHYIDAYIFLNLYVQQSLKEVHILSELMSRCQEMVSIDSRYEESVYILITMLR